MKNKKTIELVIIIFVFAVVGTSIFFLKKDTKDIKIDNNYIAVFNGKSGENIYSTYIYKIDNNRANYGFKYINTISKTTSNESSKKTIKVIKEGNIGWTDEAFEVAKNNNAYSYVLLPNDNKMYSIEEFSKIFSMD